MCGTLFTFHGGENQKNASFTCDDENNVSQSLKETTLRKSIR